MHRPFGNRPNGGNDGNRYRRDRRRNDNTANGPDANPRGPRDNRNNDNPARRQRANEPHMNPRAPRDDPVNDNPARRQRANGPYMNPQAPRDDPVNDHPARRQRANGPYMNPQAPRDDPANDHPARRQRANGPYMNPQAPRDDPANDHPARRQRANGPYMNPQAPRDDPANDNPARRQPYRRGRNNRRPNDGDRHNTRYFNFTRLQELSMMNSDDVVTTLTKKKKEFEELLHDVTKPDFLVVTLRVLTNVCRANFAEIVTSVLSHACSANFLKSLESYVKDLFCETPMEKMKNKLYHEDINRFWSNLIEFFKKVIELLPSQARDELTGILPRINFIFTNIEGSQGYTIDARIKEDASNMLQELQEEIRKVKERHRKLATISREPEIEEDPPEDFRSLSVIPTIEDLSDHMPFIRPCKIKDRYNSVEHYLDVQFRLLREDFISPLRSGLQEYLTEPQKYRSNDLRIYRKVTLIAPEVAKNSVGIKAFFGKIKQINWVRSKRLIYGGLLLLSRDNFKTILFMTVADRNEKQLEEGYILVEPCEGTTITREMYDGNFIMLESKIYFEPYLAVLTAMQHMNERNFPMENYLVNADTSTILPGYLALGQPLQYKNFNLPIGFDHMWPSPNQLRLDETQYSAFRCALTQEFAVIQGPPGTGKTFIALEIVGTLLKNKQYWERYGPIVVVCLTNHALDQFLEGILQYTKSILRVGSRSKSEALKPYTLMERRKLMQSHRKTDAWPVMWEAKRELESVSSSMVKARSVVQNLTAPEAIVPLSCLDECTSDPVLSKITSNEELVNWLIGFNVNPLPRNTLQPERQEILAEMMPDDGPEDDQDRHMDDELELTYKFQVDNSDKPIFPLKSMDALIAQLHEQIAEYRTLAMEGRALPVDPTIEWEADLNALNEQRLSLERKLAQHPVLNQQRYPANNVRWRSYWKWVKSSYDNAMNKITELETTFRQISLKLDEAKQLVDLAVMREHNIIGLTTSAAAKLHASLRALRAPIVLVEEAAEILEAHVVCSLTKNCMHVILIGDHKQLRPKASVYKLGTKYNLNISLFERMVNIRGDCTQLAHQHRMRPQIARLITPSIYDKLYNHESVLDYPSVKGLAKSLFFLSHNNREASHNNEESWVNQHEVVFLVAFARHLIMQGYDGTEITILCIYTGQLFALMQEARRYTVLKQVRVTTVDNYQGEENKIILLSLVRNNGEGKIGFLKEENRVCVALSRAREGMYIMGNMDDLLVKNDIWPKIKKVLEADDAIGDSLELRCQIHPDQSTQVRKPTDFRQSPEGGCLKKCNADLPCGHFCTSVCHTFDREHAELKCKQPCIKRCPNDHPCMLKCWEGCTPCQVKVQRQLKCGHIVIMPCSANANTFPCYVEVDAILPFCKHIITKPCHRPVEACKCPHPCETRLSCSHACRLTCHVREDPDHIVYKCFKDCTKNNLGCSNNHPCKKRCHEDCVPCPILVEKSRSCGHHHKQIQCSVNVERVQCLKPCKRKMACGHQCQLKCCEDCGNCQEKVDAILPDCNHAVKKPCCHPVKACKCPHPCENRLPCGHTCRLTCHVRVDPDHIEYKCNKPCSKNNLGCSSNHTCQKRCHEDCEPCSILVTKTRSCEHRLKVQCAKDVEQVRCGGACKRKMICGHTCQLKCWENCGNCQEKVMKWSFCGHMIEVKCSEEASPSKCNSSCQRRLACGHPCTARCKDPCNRKCETMVRQNRAGLCGHVFSVPCHLRGNASDSQLLSKYCTEPCRTLLACGHRCGGECGPCKQGRIHIPCNAPCGRILICGHKCDIPCSEACQPCVKPCELECSHSKCNNKCGIPCIPCNEPCAWKCKHRECRKPCSQLCDVEPCYRACDKKLKCKHPCVGFCGEPCPPLCRICDEEELTETFFGDEDEPDARFIFLEDCSHCIESNALVTWVSQSTDATERQSEEVQMKSCPRCKTPIRKCLRIMNELKKHMNDVLSIKKKLFGDPETLKRQQAELLKTIEHITRDRTVAEFPEIRSLLHDLLDRGTLVKNQKRQVLSRQEVEAVRIVLQIIDQMLVILKTVKLRTVNTYQSVVKNQVAMVVESLITRGQISNQEVDDIELELQRLSYLAKLCNIDERNIGLSDRDKYYAMKMKLSSIERFTKDLESEIQHEMKAVLPHYSDVSNQERQMIAKAMGFAKGHWFKCPNGHFYAIGECGGAMQVSKCNECGANIGGQSHRLLADNALASEMDGAARHAWPGGLH